jgi:hypothetical protein
MFKEVGEQQTQDFSLPPLARVSAEAFSKTIRRTIGTNTEKPVMVNRVVQTIKDTREIGIQANVILDGVVVSTGVDTPVGKPQSLNAETCNYLSALVDIYLEKQAKPPEVLPLSAPANVVSKEVKRKRKTKVGPNLKSGGPTLASTAGHTEEQKLN